VQRVSDSRLSGSINIRNCETITWYPCLSVWLTLPTNLISMSQQSGFGSGFILGSIVGGLVGGLLGATLATRNEKTDLDQEESMLQSHSEKSFESDERIELARHGLEDKIAQLNLAIDDIRQQLSSVKSNSSEQD